MSIEYEYKFIFEDDFTEKELRKKLKEMKAKHYKPILFQARTYTDNEKGLLVRLRDEGVKKTMTLKKKVEDTVFFEEFEIEINDLENADKMLHMLNSNLKLKNSVEKFREIFLINNIIVVFDSLPGLPTYIEVETDNKKDLDAFCEKIGISPSKHFEKSMYSYYYDFNPGKEITFNILNKINRKEIKKNKTLFSKIIKNQLKMLD